MKLRDVSQKNKYGPNIVGEKIDTINIHKEKDKKEKRIRIEDNSILDNLNLTLYGFLFKKFGFLKTGIGFGISGLVSILYIWQGLSVKWIDKNYLTIFFIVLLIYSIAYFQFFFNRSCPKCKSKFSLFKQGTYKVGECDIKGLPYDIDEIEYKCAECKKVFIEEEKERH